jgi:hypothetical protein
MNAKGNGAAGTQRDTIPGIEVWCDERPISRATAWTDSQELRPHGLVRLPRAVGRHEANQHVVSGGLESDCVG